MSGRKLNPHEQKLHQAALADPKKVRAQARIQRWAQLTQTTCAVFQNLTQKECDALIPDRDARTAALNFLLGTVCLVFLLRLCSVD